MAKFSRGFSQSVLGLQPRLEPLFLKPIFLFAPVLALSLPVWAQTQTLVIDDFEAGVPAWTRNDKSQIGLSDIVRTSPGASAGSKGAALLTFKTAQNSWASLSRPLDGAALSRINADRISFWLSGSGDKDGVALRLGGKTASGADVVYSLPYPVRLSDTKWRRVVIPLATFRGPRGETVRREGLTALYFSQSGSWNSRFFSLDDISVSGAPPAATPTPKPVVTNRPTVVVPGSVSVNVDFKRDIGTIRASINPAFGAGYAGNQPLETSADYRTYVSALRPRFARIDAAGFVELTDSSAPSFNFSRLVGAVRRIQAMKSQPVICLSNAPEWGLDARGYGVLCATAARALAPLKVRYFEVAAWSGDLSDGAALGFYNAGYGAIKGVSKTHVVGGFGAPAGDEGAQNTLLKGARGLDFLSVSFFGATSGTPGDAALMDSARTIFPLKTAAGLLDKSRFKKAALFVTQANVSGARAPGDFVPSDVRLVQPIAGAWWGQFLASGSRLADQIFHSDATNPEWGFLDADARAYPAFYTAFLWNTFFQSGSQRVKADAANGNLAVVACNTPTAHNLLIVNTTNAEQTAQIAIRGFPVLREARLRLQGQLEAQKLPTSPFQSVKLAPYGAVVVQFIEPPRVR